VWWHLQEYPGPWRGLDSKARTCTARVTRGSATDLARTAALPVACMAQAEKAPLLAGQGCAVVELEFLLEDFPRRLNCSASGSAILLVVVLFWGLLEPEEAVPVQQWLNVVSLAACQRVPLAGCLVKHPNACSCCYEPPLSAQRSNDRELR